MQAIAKLVEHDPYLDLPLKERVAARRDRRDRLSKPFLALVETPAIPPVEETEPTPEFKALWFGVVEDITTPPPAECDELEPRCPSIAEIQIRVGKHYDVSRAEMICARRTQHLVLPRHVAMYLCKILTPRSHPDIGRRFGNRDHTVSLYAFRKIERLVSADPVLAADVEALAASLIGAA